MFGVVIYDKSDDSYYACRDHLGKIPSTLAMVQMAVFGLHLK